VLASSSAYASPMLRCKITVVKFLLWYVTPPMGDPGWPWQRSFWSHSAMLLGWSFRIAVVVAPAMFFLGVPL
jgi:hypothetical protein